MPRAVSHIFEHIKLNPNKGQFRVTLSFLEIYMEQITDLLDGGGHGSRGSGQGINRARSSVRGTSGHRGNQQQSSSISPMRKPAIGGRISPLSAREDPSQQSGLQIREDPKTGIFVEGLTQVHVKSKEQLLQYVKQGMKRRQVNQTGMNKNSSRSHAVLNVFLEQIWVEKKNTPGSDQQQSTGEAQATAKSEQDGGADVVKKRHYRKALLTIVDLAGSERLNKTGSESMRLQEAKNINKSIAALGNCIAMLAQSSEKSMSQMGSFSHIPFRDSKVTRLLSESLSGNCKTTICACISPSLVHYEETYSTLLFASRAMNVRTEAQRNEKIDLKYQRKAGPQQAYGNYPYGGPPGLHTSSSHDTVLPHSSIEQGERQYLESSFVQSQSEIQLRR